jgi:hypothetical protein
MKPAASFEIASPHARKGSVSPKAFPDCCPPPNRSYINIMLLSGEIKLRFIGDFSKRAGKFHPWPTPPRQTWTGKKLGFPQSLAFLFKIYRIPKPQWTFLRIDGHLGNN